MYFITSFASRDHTGKHCPMAAIDWKVPPEFCFPALRAGFDAIFGLQRPSNDDETPSPYFYIVENEGTGGGPPLGVNIIDGNDITEQVENGLWRQLIEESNRKKILPPKWVEKDWLRLVKIGWSDMLPAAAAFAFNKWPSGGNTFPADALNEMLCYAFYQNDIVTCLYQCGKGVVFSPARIWA
jgi:hypothetical protein